tara:strand:+ start:178 stop:738 length:561 start_codon:yes stop_codon:yes gene_type:complete
MKKIIFAIFLILSNNCIADANFDSLKKEKKTSYLDFVLLKIENKLMQRHSLLGPQYFAVRIQYQNIGSEVSFDEKKSKIIVSITGVMDKRRYTKKKYRPKISDCNVLRNILLYGKHGYSSITQKRNKYLTNDDMNNIFISRFLNNLSLSKTEKEFIVKNTLVNSLIIDPVRGNDIACTGNVAKDLN